MIPQLVTVRVRRPARRPLRIWVPVLPVLLVFSPLVVLAGLVAAVACLVYRISLLRALGTGWRIACASRGTQVEIEHGRAGVLVAIR